MAVGAIKFADKYIGNAICRAMALFRPNKTFSFKEPKKLLIIQLWGIGETILTLPALNALKQKFPNSQITSLATSRNHDVYYSIKGIKLITINLNPLSILN